MAKREEDTVLIIENGKLTDAFGRSAIAVHTESGSVYALSQTPEEAKQVSGVAIIPRAFTSGRRGNGGGVGLSGFAYNRPGKDDARPLSTSGIAKIVFADSELEVPCSSPSKQVYSEHGHDLVIQGDEKPSALSKFIKRLGF